MGVREACLVMVSDRQERLESAALTRWANEFGIGMTLFHGWAEFVDQALFWAAQPKPVAASDALGLIHERLISVEASTAAVESWGRLTDTLLRPDADGPPPTITKTRKTSLS